MTQLPTAPFAGGSLIFGYVVARRTGVRPLGGLVLATAGVSCARTWSRRAGPGTATVLLGIYATAFVASHPLAKLIGAWPAVLASAGVSGAASWVLADQDVRP